MILLRRNAPVCLPVIIGMLIGNLVPVWAQESAKDDSDDTTRPQTASSAAKPPRKSAKRSAVKKTDPESKTGEAAAKPENPAGSPLSPDRALVSQQVHHLLQSVQAGRITLLHPPRESEQLRSLEGSGVYLWPPPPAPAVKTGKATAKKDTKTPTSRLSAPQPAEKPGSPFASAANSIVSILPGGRITDNAPSRQASSDFRVPGVGIDSGLVAAAPSVSEPAPVTTPPAPALFHMLNTLAAHSTPAHPLELMSLLRPPYQTAVFRHAGPRNPHSLGLAADIGAYAGHRIRPDDPEDSIAMVLALLRDLPPGRYRMGMPKAPETPLMVGQSPAAGELAAILAELAPGEPLSSLLPSPSIPASMQPPLPSRARRRRQTVATPPTDAPEPEFTEAHSLLPIAAGLYAGLPRDPWPFFPPPEPELEDGLIAPLRQNGRVVLDSAGRPQPHIIRFRNEGYAPESALGDPRVRKALEAARKRGADVFALFPDGPDHIHLDVKPQP